LGGRSLTVAALTVYTICENGIAVSQLAQEFKNELAELDVNPLMVLPEGRGVKAVDALMVVR